MKNAVYSNNTHAINYSNNGHHRIYSECGYTKFDVYRNTCKLAGNTFNIVTNSAIILTIATIFDHPVFVYLPIGYLYWCTTEMSYDRTKLTVAVVSGRYEARVLQVGLQLSQVENSHAFHRTRKNISVD